MHKAAREFAAARPPFLFFYFEGLPFWTGFKSWNPVLWLERADTVGASAAVSELEPFLESPRNHI